MDEYPKIVQSIECKCFRCKSKTISTAICAKCRKDICDLYKFVRKAIFELEIEYMIEGENSLFDAYFRVQKLDWNIIEERAIEMKDETKTKEILTHIESFNKGIKNKTYHSKAKCPVCSGIGERTDARTNKKRSCIACSGTGII